MLGKSYVANFTPDPRNTLRFAWEKMMQPYWEYGSGWTLDKAIKQISDRKERTWVEVEFSKQTAHETALMAFAIPENVLFPAVIDPRTLTLPAFVERVGRGQEAQNDRNLIELIRQEDEMETY